MLGGYVEILQKYGLVKSVDKKENIEIPKFMGSYDIEYMKEVKN